MPQIAITHKTLNSRDLLESNEEVWSERVHFREVLNWGRSVLRGSVLVLVCLFLFLCSEKPQEKMSNVESFSPVFKYSVTLQLGSQRFHSPPQFAISLYPSLTNSHKSPPINSFTQSTETHSTHGHTLTQVCNCNQAHNSVFTAECFSSKI